MGRLLGKLGTLTAAMALGGLLGGARVHAACGDAVLDTGEACDDGTANGQDGCCSASCQLVDRDGDGTCDALDPCDDNAGSRIKDATLLVAGLRTAAADKHLRFTGTMTIVNSMTVPPAPAIDPSVSGIRLRMFAGWTDPHGSVVADVSIPGGPPWLGRAHGTKWTYRDRAGLHGGIRRIDLTLLPPLVPTTHLTKVAFLVDARRGSFPVTPAMVTSDVLQVTLGLGDSASNRQCANAYYTAVQPTHCTFTPSGSKVTCKGPPPVGPCHVGDPNDLLVCDAVDAAHAEDAYFAVNGFYFTGACTALPGFVPSPGVTCSASGTATAFTLLTSDPEATYVSGCVWSSDPGPSNPNLTCS